MPDQVLELTLESFTVNELALKVKNVSQGALVKKLSIGLTLPQYLLDARIIAAAKRGASNPDPPGAANVTEITGPSGWSIWVMMGDTSESIVDILLYNHRNNAGQKVTPPTKVETGAEFILRIPLDAKPVPATLDIPYSYQHADRMSDPSVKGELKWTAPNPGEWKPNVTLETDSTSPTMVIPGKEVEISWHVGDAVSATLRGPLPGGNSELELTDQPSPFNLSDGAFKITVVGPMTYVLQAQVKRPDGTSVQVVKMLFLDVDRGKYGFVSPRPSRVLPYGLVEVDWAAWGVKAASLTTVGASRRIPLTDMTVTGYPKGSGVMRVTAGTAEIETNVFVKLNVELGQSFRKESEDDYTVVPWTKLKNKSNFQGRPIGAAVAGGTMALLTSEGLWLATVGKQDSFAPVVSLTFTKATTDVPKTWLAISGFGERFVVLRKTNQDDLQVAFYEPDGSLARYSSGGSLTTVTPLDLPGLRPFITGGAVFDLAVYGGRAYVTVERSSPEFRRAFSVGINNGKAEYRNEILLERFSNYRLITFANAMYALNRDSGEMVRFELEAEKLNPYKAASAVDEQGASRVKQGLFVPVGDVLAVLSPSSVPSITALAPFGLKNILPYENLSPPRDVSTLPQDLVYGPQHDRWSRCGHGLDAEGAVAYRGGDSPRLWMIDADRDIYTLTVLSEHLFLHNYVTDLPPAPLTEVFNKKRGLAFINHTGMEFVPMSETLLKAGITPFSAIGRAHLSSPIPTGPTSPKIAEPVDLWYNEVERPTAILRLLAKRAPGVKHEYLLEVTLSGPAFSWGKVVFKRIALDERGNITSIAVVPDIDEFPPHSGLIERFPRQLTNGIRLRIRNTTPYTLWLLSPDATDPADQARTIDPETGIRIRYNTPAFSIYAHGAGELPVDVDFSLPHGIEMSPASEAQKKRIRIRQSGPLTLDVDSVSIKEARDYDDYECTINHQIQERLTGAYLGDGVPSQDGASIYVPIAEPPNVTNAKILKITAENLQITAQTSVVGRSIFSCPNSVVALQYVVVAIFNREQFHVFDHSLKTDPQGFFPKLSDFEFNVITQLKCPAGNIIYLMGMKEEPTWQIKNSYKYYRWSLSPVRPEEKGVLDFLKSYRPGRVPGAPPWVAPNIITPMDVRIGAALAICVEGGVSGYDLKNDFKELAVELPGTGREEAILVDRTEHLIFSAHSKSSGSGLLISRINVANPTEKLTIELSGAATHMVTDLKPPTVPNLDYHRARAVSLLATSDALFVSFARKIYVLDKTKLTQRQSVQLRLPVRLIEARRGFAPTATFGGGLECYWVWAIGSRYAGDGQEVKRSGVEFETMLYKLAIGL